MLERLSTLSFTAWLLIFLLIPFFILIGNLLLRNQAAAIHKRLTDMEVLSNGTDQDKIMKLPLSKRLMLMAEEYIGKFVEKHVEKGKLAPLKIKLIQANMEIEPLHHHSHRFIYAILFSGVSLLLANPMVTIGAFALGVFVPDLRLQEALKKRQLKLKSEIADFLDLLSATVGSSNNLEDAIAKVCSRTPGEVSTEFRKALDEYNTGRPLRDALENMSLRCGVEEIERLISQINQSEIMGVGVEKTLKTQAERMRTLKKQLAEIKARKASVLLILPSLLLLVTCLVVIVGPSVIGVFDPQAVFKE